MSNCLFEVDDSIDGRVVITFPLFDTRSEANCNENWRTKHKRHKHQKGLIAFCMPSIKDKVKLPCKVTMTRLSTRKIDWDNNVSAFKYVRDAISAHLTGDFRPGRADNDERILWDYQQEKAKKKGIRLLFE